MNSCPRVKKEAGSEIGAAEGMWLVLVASRAVCVGDASLPNLQRIVNMWLWSPPNEIQQVPLVPLVCCYEPSSAIELPKVVTVPYWDALRDAVMKPSG